MTGAPSGLALSRVSNVWRKVRKLRRADKPEVVVEPSTEIRKAVSPYREVIARFVLGEISADEFETRYLAQYKADPTIWPAAVFDILDEVFFYVDDYVGDPELRARAGGLDGASLKARAAEALEKLEPYLPADVGWLVEEADSLLDMSDVGLYELVWMQRGRNANTPEDEMRRNAMEALRHLLASGRGRLVWLKWPSSVPVEGLPIGDPAQHDFDDPSEEPYLVLARD